MTNIAREIIEKHLGDNLDELRVFGKKISNIGETRRALKIARELDKDYNTVIKKARMAGDHSEEAASDLFRAAELIQNAMNKLNRLR